MPLADLRERTAALMPEVVEELTALTRLPSIAFPGFPPEPVLAAAEATAALFRGAGVADARLLEVPGGYPAVYAEIPAPAGTPTVLLYAHYDIQPAPLEQGWTTDPFAPVVKEGRLYGRGAADDKSGVMMHVAAMRLFGGRPPVGVRLLIEGEEETGNGLGPFVEANPELARCDAFVIADGGNSVAGHPELNVALRGVVTCTVTVRTLASMVHSGGYGGAAPDALMALATILHRLLDEHGDVAVPGLTRFDWDGDDVPEEGFRAAAGVLPGVELIGTGSLASRLWTRPSVTAIGIDAPPVAGASNSLIPEARARISLRIAPGSDPAASQQALMDHIRASAPWGVLVEVTPGELGNAFKAPTGGPIEGAARAAMREVFGRAVVSTASGGSIPLLGTLRTLAPEAEFVVWGAQEGQRSAAHGPNESQDLAELERMILAEARFLELLGERVG
ncbi:MAG: M20/M25/M40 family metallo-hydrolase [Chloroflexia bacterium]|nr:M20/M25/M40 family metallo-hydrolase [Chloroflexia bacterium]